ncbi:MAG: ArsR/SmtB family transcription factor [Promethearchaeota archaeon]
MPKDLIVKDEDVSKVTKALSSETRWQILKLLKNEALSVSQLAERIYNIRTSRPQTEANISAQIKLMEGAGLIKTHYEPGEHGVKKVCRPAVDRIILVIG